MVHVRAIHQHFHLVSLILPAFPLVCYIKCSIRFCEKTTFFPTHNNDSHHRGSTLLHWKKRCAASSFILLHNGHVTSDISTCLFLKLAFVGSLFLMSLHANAALGGILSFHNSTKGLLSTTPLLLSTICHMLILSNNFHSGQPSKPMSLLPAVVLIAFQFPV